MKFIRLLILILILLSLCSGVYGHSKSKAKTGMCHTCQCNGTADKCTDLCGKKNICVIACTHDCLMHQLGIKKCPKPDPKQKPALSSNNQHSTSN